MPRLTLALALLAIFVAPAAAGSKVNYIYPSANAAAPAPDPAPMKAIQQNVAVTIVVVRPHRDSVKNDLFQNWTGFINEYDGPRYPF